MLKAPRALRRTPWVPTTGLALLIAAAAALSTACRGSDTSGDPLAIGGRTETVIMEDTKFQPGNLQVPVGATVTFTNRDAAPHDAQPEDGSWETERLSKDESDSVTFDKPGEWLYKCTIHPSMKARITVAEDGETRATPTAAP
jgi:plastocyanin